MNRYLATSKTSREPIRIRKVSISSSRLHESRSKSKSSILEPTSPSNQKPLIHKKPNLISKTNPKSNSSDSEDSVILSLNNLLKQMTSPKPQRKTQKSKPT